MILIPQANGFTSQCNHKNQRQSVVQMIEMFILQRIFTYQLFIFIMIKEQYKHSYITSKVIAAAMEVHKILGNGFQEFIYQRALEKEMILQGLTFKREFEMPIFYKREQIGLRRVDFMVEGVVAIEIKALVQVEDVHLAQAINYLEAYNLEVGMLINFGAKSLQFKRLINSKRPADQH